MLLIELFDNVPVNRVDENATLVWARQGDKIIRKFRCPSKDLEQTSDVVQKKNFVKTLDAEGYRLRKKAKQEDKDGN